MWNLYFCIKGIALKKACDYQKERFSNKFGKNISAEVGFELVSKIYGEAHHLTKRPIH